VRNVVGEGHGSHEGHGHEGHGHEGHGHAGQAHPSAAEPAAVLHLDVNRGSLTPADVRNKVFATVRLREGYDMAQVDTFLDQVEAAMTRILQENAALRARPDSSRQPAAPAGAGAPHIVALAQEAADRAIAMAQEEAREIIAEAGGRAEAAKREVLSYGGRMREGLQRQIRQLQTLLAELENKTTRIPDLSPPTDRSPRDAGSRNAFPGAATNVTG
jgi:DivIVA domain-containing protein